MTQWEKFFDEKIKEIAKQKKVLDIGGGYKFQKELALYKGYFANCDYRTVEIDQKFKPDILADIHNLPLPDNSVDGVICKAVLEHVKNPIKATEEIYRILKPSGKCFIWVPFIYPYHGKGSGEKDYWRFSQDGVQYLFRKFNKIEICPVRGHLETVFNLLPYQNKFPFNIFVKSMRILDKISSKCQKGQQSSGFNIFLIK